jgi:PAS domain S-box-containing protein
VKKNNTGFSSQNTLEIMKPVELDKQMDVLLQNVPGALLRLDRESRLVYCSTAFLKLMAVDDFEYIKRRSLLELHQLTKNEVLAGPVLNLFEYLKKGNPSVRAETLMNFPGLDGARTFTIEANRVLNEDGDFDGVVALCHDVTETKNSESDERTRIMLDATPLACFLMNKDGYVYDCNWEALNLFGAESKHDFKDEFFLRFMPEYQSNGNHSYSEALNRIHIVLTTGGRMHFEWEYITTSGKTFPAEVTLVCVDGQGGSRVAAYIRDFSEIKANEERRRLAESRVHTMLDAMPLACVLLNDIGQAIDCNVAALQLFEVEFKENVLKQYYDWMPEYQPDGLPSLTETYRRIQEVFKTGYSCSTWMHQTASGEALPAEVTLVRVEWNSIFCIAAYIRDLRGIYEKEKEAREAEERTLAMLNSSPLACSLWDENGIMIDCNQEAVELLELEDKSSYINGFYNVNPEFQPDGEPTHKKAMRLIKAAFETGYQRFNWMYRTSRGEDLPVETILRRIPWKGDYRLAAYSRDLREFIAAQNEKNEAEERTLAMLNATPLACTLWDENMVILDCNQEVLDLFGIEKKSDYFGRFFELNPEFQPDGELSFTKAERLGKAALATGYQRFNWTYRTAQGEDLPTETILRRISWKGGYRLAAYSRDLREFIAAQNEKNEAEERMRQMLDTSPLICTMWDANLNFIDCNQEALRVFGVRDKETFLKTFPFDFIPEYQNDGVATHLRGIVALQKALETGYYQYECTYLTANGEPLPTETIHIRIAWKDTYHIIVYCRDLRSINEKEKEILQAEEELHLKRNHMDLMADINKFTYWETDSDDGITFSYHLEREFGYSPKEITKVGFYDSVVNNPPSKWIDIVHPDDRARVLRDFIDYASGRSKRYRSEIRMRHKNGEYLWTVTSGQIIKWKDGKPLVTIGGIFNINDLKRTESANTAKSRFLASMSHEIRTPMNAIIGMSDLIRMDNMDMRQKEFFHDLRIMSKSLLQIINDILDFSKIESEKMELSPIHFDLLNLYDNIVSLNRFMAENKGLEFRSSFDNDVTQIVYGDDMRIRQIITNLLSNAIKYTPGGFVDFRVKRVTENGQVYTAFQVEDSGVGIREENFLKLFDWYAQFDTAQNRGISGTGLGLPITKSFVDMMNGRIDVKSKYGKGSVFTVLLPIPEGDPSKVERAATSNIFVTDGSAKVLVVDDNAINLKVALAYLEVHNIKAETAESGMEALKKIKEKQYHLIFMDHMMPEMDGIETCARIRADDNEWYKTVPIIALSANAVVGAGVLFLESGMNDCLYKPIEASELNRLLAKWLPPEIITQKPIPAKINMPEFDSPGYGEHNGLLIDRVAGIANAVGSETLYQQLLTDFKFSHNMDLQKIMAAQNDEDYQSARRIAHTLKSTANLIGAKTLGNAALTAEKALELKNKIPLAQSIWDTLEKEFNAVMAELEQITPGIVKGKPRHQAGELDISSALAFIKKLEPLLESGSSSSLNLLDDIREILAPAGEEYEELIARIENLDFAEASDVLNQIREKVANLS